MYLDTSVLVKRYTPEPDSDEVDGAIVGNTIVTSELAVSELWSALLAKERAEILTESERATVWEFFLNDIDNDVVHLIPLNGLMLREANEIMARVQHAPPRRRRHA